MASRKLLHKAGDQLQEDSALPMAELMLLRQLPKGPKLQQTLKLFRGEKAETIIKEIGYFVTEVTGAAELHILHMFGEEFEVIDTKSTDAIMFSCKKMSGISDAVFKRSPVLLEKGFTASWKGIFKSHPEYLILIPITVCSNKSLFIMGTAALAYFSAIPKQMEEERTWHLLMDYLQLTVPLIINVQRFEDSENRRQRFVEALEALIRVEMDIQDLHNCVKTLACEIAKFLCCKFVQVLLITEEIVEEKKLRKYCSLGTPEVNRAKCPEPTCHENEEVKLLPNSCTEYVVLHGKTLRANNPEDLDYYGIQATSIHSIGGCFVSNILCIPLCEQSGEAPLIMELSEKKNGFSHRDEEQGEMFAKRAGLILTSAILLNNKKKSVRRHGIRNEVLANIGEVSYFRVSQLLDLKFDYSSSFLKQFEDFRFSMRIFPDHQSPGVLLYMFLDLGFAQKWNMKRSTLIRFILSMQQGYRDIPYHNWKHACSVTHFAYLLIKRLGLVKLGYLNELEVLTLMISCLCHDVDHRGRNNHFNLCIKSELYHLYKQEDSIMERHHIAVTLSVLNSEDCNILQNLADNEYREFLELIQWNIMATDLSKYMQKKLEYIYTLSHFDAADSLHRRHFSAMIMVTADLSDHIKTWDANLPTIKNIFSEFFTQGDDEIALGMKPMPVMDRRLAYIPQIEIQFINNVVRPAYYAIAELLPMTKVCLETLDYHVDLWLIATAVFDDHEKTEENLSILDLPAMKEKNLRRRSGSNLQPILDAHGIAATTVTSRTTLDTLNLEPTQSESSVKDYDNADEKRRSSLLDEPAKREKTSCYALAKNWLCCFFCRNRGLVKARAVRQYGLEEEYLDKRVTQYEARAGIDATRKEQAEAAKRASMF